MTGALTRQHHFRLLFFGCGDGNLYALDASTGALRWKLQTGDVIHASPAYADGAVYVGCRDSNLYAIDAQSGTEKWRVNNQGSWVIGSPAVTQDKVVYATSDSALFHEVDAASGKPLLKQDVKAYTFASPTVRMPP